MKKNKSLYFMLVALAIVIIIMIVLISNVVSKDSEENPWEHDRFSNIQRWQEVEINRTMMLNNNCFYCMEHGQRLV